MPTKMCLSNPLCSGVRKKPTQKHRPALWECILGTVYAMNDAGEVRYFDYNWKAAFEFANVANKEDVRSYKASGKYTFTPHLPKKGKLVLWVESSHDVQPTFNGSSNRTISA